MDVWWRLYKWRVGGGGESLSALGTTRGILTWLDEDT